MIAVITSTITPLASFSYFSPQDRLDQTIVTIEKLYEVGFKQVFLIDNSSQDIKKHYLESKYPYLKVWHQEQYAFANKGLNEALLLLNNIHRLPENTSIFKISGRYYPSNAFQLHPMAKETDFIGLGKNFNTRVPWLSTRAYFVKNKTILEEILVLSIEEMISYSKGIHGIRSFGKAIKLIFLKKIGTSFQLSLETAFGMIIRQKLNFKLVDKLNIEGFIAGSKHQDFITE